MTQSRPVALTTAYIQKALSIYLAARQEERRGFGSPFNTFKTSSSESTMFESELQLPRDHLWLQDFRGRDPSSEALLRHNDLLPAAA